MPSIKPSALKKLSDDALRKRLQELEDGLNESSELFATEAKRIFASVEKDLATLRDINIEERIAPIIRDGEEQLDKMHDEFVQAIERETKMLEADDEVTSPE